MYAQVLQIKTFKIYILAESIFLFFNLGGEKGRLLWALSTWQVSLVIGGY